MVHQLIHCHCFPKLLFYDHIQNYLDSSGENLLQCYVFEGTDDYLIDLTKGRHAEMTGHGPEDAGYWRAFGVDQLAHQVTYVGIVWAWLAFGA